MLGYESHCHRYIVVPVYIGFEQIMNMRSNPSIRTQTGVKKNYI